jgi:NAD(P)H-hydrate epimerase
MKAVETYKCVVLLKGARTLIVSPEGKMHINTNGNAGMASGGSGDVLTGVVAALLAQGLRPEIAATTGAYIHGLAGDLAAAELGGTTGLNATDIISMLPKAIARCQHSARAIQG